MAKQCKQCGKRSHASELRAYGAALCSSRSFGAGLRVYRCPHGNGFHLTTKPKRGRHAA